MKYPKTIVIFILGFMMVFSVPQAIDGVSTTGNDTNVTLSETVQPYGIPMISLGAKICDETITLAANNENLSKPDVNSDLNKSEVNTKFNEIRNIPYNEKSMNCKNKSELFAAYLKNNGGTEIYIVTIQHDSDEYSHEFVEWNGTYYDACNNNELSYLVSKQDYMNQLHDIGFNGVTVQSPY